jgi:hypothetical protein
MKQYMNKSVISTRGGEIPSNLFIRHPVDKVLPWGFLAFGLEMTG